MRGQGPAALIMGSVQLGLAYGAANRAGKPARETALQLVRRAADSGIGGFDTGRSYGEAEARLGEALAGRKVYMTTKLAPLSDLPQNAPESDVYAEVDASIAQSLTALKTSSLDCVMLHRAWHRTGFGGAVWERLKTHMAQGTIGVLGVSVQSPSEALSALSDPVVQHMQLPFNLLDWRWAEAGVIAAMNWRKDVTVHARSVFLQGVLPSADARVWPKIPGVDPAAVKSWLDKQARAFDRAGIADLCLSYVRGQDWIDAVVIGMENGEQLSTNLGLMTLPPMQKQDCGALESCRPRLPVEFLDPAQWPRP